MPQDQVIRPSQRSVAIIGGGISGLAAAYFLRDTGLAVTVLEGSPRLGGKLAVSDIAGVAVDSGAEALLARRPEGTGLIGQAATTISQAATQAASTVGDVGTAVGQIATLVTSGSFWLRILEFILGAAALYLGLHALTGQSSTPGQQAQHVRTVFLPI